MNFIDRVFTLYYDENDSSGKIDTSDERAAFEKVEEVDNAGEEKENEGEKEEGEELSDDKDSEEHAEDEEEVSEEESEAVDQSTIQQLKKIDKDIFKKAPELRSIIFRESKYSEIFPTVEDAQSANESQELFNALTNDVTNGNLEPLIESIDKTGKDSLEAFAANILPAIEKTNRELYHNILAPHFKRFLRIAAKHSDENIAISARNINHWLFEDGDVDKDAGLSPKSTKKSDRESEIDRREREFEEKRYNSFANDVNEVAQKRVGVEIKRVFANSDMAPLIQDQLTKEIFRRVDALMAKDTRHVGNMNNLWKRAQNEGYTTEGKNRILNAYLSRAKVLIPKIRAKVLSEAKVSPSAKSEDNNRGNVTRIPANNTSSSGARGRVDAKKVDWDKTDERAALDGKLVMRK